MGAGSGTQSDSGSSVLEVGGVAAGVVAVGGAGVGIAEAVDSSKSTATSAAAALPDAPDGADDGSSIDE